MGDEGSIVGSSVVGSAVGIGVGVAVGIGVGVAVGIGVGSAVPVREILSRSRRQNSDHPHKLLQR